MKKHGDEHDKYLAKAGFTLPEVIVATAISVLVAAGVMTTFIWCGNQAALCSKISWSQKEAMNSSEKLTMYVRNASEISSIDEVEGTWVEFLFPDGSTGRLSYSNAVPDLRDGKMYFVGTNGTDLIVARGLTEIQSSQGFTTPMFMKTRDNALRISYRVSEPTSSGIREANDSDFAASVSFAVCLRNKAQL